MALPHAAPGAAIAVLRPGNDFSRFTSQALAKTSELELIRLILPKGKAMPEHHVAGEITLFCLRGEITVDVHGAATILQAGEMLYLSGGQAHALHAVQDALVLLTILLV